MDKVEKIIVVSTSNNPDYYFYSPYIAKAWRTYGWKVACVITHDVNPSYIEADYIIQMPEIPNIRTATIAQAGRLYAANTLPSDSLLMTSDMDLLPLSDYWKPNENEITVYGHDLTDFSYIPMGYVAMSCAKWKEVMKLTANTFNDFERDAKEIELPYAEDWNLWWNHDWTLLTKRLSGVSGIVHVKRGRRENSPFAFGRIDRGDSMQMIPKPWVDSHLENVNVKHPDKLNKFLAIFEEIYGKL